MSPIREDQKKLLFDYVFGLTSEEEGKKAEELLEEDIEAKSFHGVVEGTLKPLEHADNEPCPDYLVENTVSRLCTLSSSEDSMLGELLEAEQNKSKSQTTSILLNFGRRLATAAVFIIVGLVVINTMRVVHQYAHSKHLISRCGVQMSNIGQGLNLYKNENDNSLPAVAASSNAPWWKIGHQGEENCSNTRPLWLLVRGGYVKAGDFICPASEGYATKKITDCNEYKYDFPCRKSVTYSFRILSDPDQLKRAEGATPLIADVNPLFADLPEPNNGLKIRVDEKMEQLNSINHGGKGQNILFNDGSVRFFKTRHVGIEKEDIFTLKNTVIYKGNERPSSKSDIFLAP